MKYAIMVPFDTNDDDEDMLYVTEGDTKFQLRVKLFDTITAAHEHAAAWGERAVVVQFNRPSSIL